MTVSCGPAPQPGAPVGLIGTSQVHEKLLVGQGVLEQDARRIGKHDTEQWHRLKQAVSPRDRLD